MVQVSFAQKLAYASSGFGGSVCIGAMTYLMYFYTDIALLGVGLAGLATGIGSLFDAMNDPLVGYYSDKTRTRWGRRRPWIAVATVPAAVAYMLLFRPPLMTDQHLLFFYLLAALLAVDAFATMAYIPGAALGLELSSNYQERTQIFALATFFNNLGTIVGGFLPFAVASFADVRTGYAQMTFIFAIVGVATNVLLLLVPERTVSSSAPAHGLADFVQGYYTCLRNRLFRTLLLTFLVINLGGGLSLGVSVYALIYWLGFTQTEVGLIIPVWLGSSCLALPFWTWISGRVGKGTALRWVLGYETLVLFAIYFLIPNKLVVYTFMIFSGFGYAGFVIVTSLLADVLDVDELETGAQRAGAFLGFWSVIVKAAQSVGPLLVGWALAVTGYVPNVPQTPLVIYIMRLLYGPIPALLFIASYLLFRHFSLTRERLSEVQAELARRRATASVAVEI